MASQLEAKRSSHVTVATVVSVYFATETRVKGQA